MPQETVEELNRGQKMLKKGGNQLKTHELDHASPIEKRMQSFAVPSIGLPSALYAITMGDSHINSSIFSSRNDPLSRISKPGRRGLLKEEPHS
jgi:hypothetical protein